LKTASAQFMGRLKRTVDTNQYIIGVISPKPFLNIGKFKPFSDIQYPLFLIHDTDTGRFGLTGRGIDTTKIPFTAHIF
jgi:hypothetical protein